MYLGHRYLTVLLTCVALILGGSAAAQTITSSGKVVDANGEPVIGASVIQKGSTTNGVITDVDGAFKLVVPSGATIEVSCIGYVTVDVAAAANLV
ncbi:MAG: carboxypeptidase-like regulatory domain-containing protein, partial [Bacteroidales bacterium]|nr:carboxypeptidase-like regulatory domain-containing protein [Bacteroidales bacterium]